MKLIYYNCDSLIYLFLIIFGYFSEIFGYFNEMRNAYMQNHESKILQIII